MEPGQIKLSPDTYEYRLHTYEKAGIVFGYSELAPPCHMHRPLDLESSAPMGFLPS